MRRLREELDELRSKLSGPDEPSGPEGPDLEALRRLAAEEADRPAGEEEEKGATVFRSGGLSLQALNPEISVTGDLFYTFTYEEGATGRLERGDFVFRGLGLHFEAYLDPYTRFKAAVPVNAGGAGLGEAYLTRYGAWEGLNLTAGKFRQQFGVINRWHKHGLDQLDFPYALRQVFGDGGLNQVGLSLEQKLPQLWCDALDLTVQLTNGQNPRLFAGNALSTPSICARLKSYWDLSPSTYFEVGLSGLAGWRDEWLAWNGTALEAEERSLWTAATCLDLVLNYEPTNRMRHFTLEWRTEVYGLHRNVLAADGSGRTRLDAWGFTTVLHAKVSRTWEVGAQGGLWDPAHRDWEGAHGVSFAPHVSDRPNAYRAHGALYVTWWQSPFVRFRLQYDVFVGHDTGPAQHQLTLQAVFAAGPHKHERY